MLPIALEQPLARDCPPCAKHYKSSPGTEALVSLPSRRFTFRLTCGDLAIFCLDGLLSALKAASRAKRRPPCSSLAFKGKKSSVSFFLEQV
jgi:hypothetical protein